jgi:hypothetical protein
VTGTQTAASTVGGVITGTSASVTGGVTAASVAGGVITGTSTSVTGTQTAASTVGGVITGSSVSVTGAQTAASTVGGVITGTSTSLLTCQGSTIVDASTVGSSISTSGTNDVVIVNNNYPFNQTTQTVSNISTLFSISYYYSRLFQIHIILQMLN